MRRILKNTYNLNRQGGLSPLLAGNANNGTNAGVRYANTNNRVSNANANIGFRLYRQFISDHQALPLGKIVSLFSAVLVAQANALFTDGTLISKSA